MNKVNERSRLKIFVNKEEHREKQSTIFENMDTASKLYFKKLLKCGPFFLENFFAGQMLLGMQQTSNT